MASDSRRRGSQITGSYIASDKRLDGISERLNSDSAKRADVVVFDEKIVFSDTNPAEHPISSITPVKFKRPGRDDYTATDNPIMQSFELAQKIRSGQFMRRGRSVFLKSTVDNALVTAGHLAHH